MNEQHLMFWIWKYLESHGMHEDIINRAISDDWQFSETPKEGSWAVSQALKESLDNYKKVKK